MITYLRHLKNSRYEVQASFTMRDAVPYLLQRLEQKSSNKNSLAIQQQMQPEVRSSESSAT